MTRPFTCRAIARPFARLAIARFYVYGLLNTHRLIMHILHGSSDFGYQLLSNSRSGWVIARTL